MTPGRSNGLPAGRYTPLVDLEPHLADALLDALRTEGVAAYAAPAPGRRGPYLDIVLPDRPTDRVWVDAGEHTKAREVLRELPELAEATTEHGGGAPPPQPLLSDAESDAAWQAIVAGFGRTSEDPVPPWPVIEDTAAQDPPEAAVPVGGDNGWGGNGWAADAPDATGAEPTGEPAEDPQDHFVPPPPPPLPRLAARTKLAWAGVLAGPLYLALGEFGGLDLFYGAQLLALLSFIGGFAALVYRMKDERDPDSGPDDGAVV